MKRIFDNKHCNNMVLVPTHFQVQMLCNELNSKLTRYDARTASSEEVITDIINSVKYFSELFGLNAEIRGSDEGCAPLFSRGVWYIRFYYFQYEERKNLIISYNQNLDLSSKSFGRFDVRFHLATDKELEGTTLSSIFEIEGGNDDNDTASVDPDIKETENTISSASTASTVTAEKLSRFHDYMLINGIVQAELSNIIEHASTSMLNSIHSIFKLVESLIEDNKIDLTTEEVKDYLKTLYNIEDMCKGDHEVLAYIIANRVAVELNDMTMEKINEIK